MGLRIKEQNFYEDPGQYYRLSRKAEWEDKRSLNRLFKEWGLEKKATFQLL